MWVHGNGLRDLIKNVVRYQSRCFSKVSNNRRDYMMSIGTSALYFNITRSGLGNLRIDLNNIKMATTARGFKQLATCAKDPRHVQDSAARLFNQFKKEFKIDRLN